MKYFKLFKLIGFDSTYEVVKEEVPQKCNRQITIGFIFNRIN